MKLFAISDLHVGSGRNLKLLEGLSAHPHDWLIVAGDVGETVDHLRLALDIVVPRFAQVVWTPGNHDLWAIDPEFGPLRGEMKYRRLVEICRSYGVLTPEDPFAPWPDTAADDTGNRNEGIVLAPLFLLYDHSFRPENVAHSDAVEWARRQGFLSGDEELLDPTPHGTREDWCDIRLQLSAQRLEQVVADGSKTVLINHFPLREDLIHPAARTGLAVWSGTRKTNDWHIRFNAAAVVHGHLHMPATHRVDGIRFDEVSLGYPNERDGVGDADRFLRQILPDDGTA